LIFGVVITFLHNIITISTLSEEESGSSHETYNTCSFSVVDGLKAKAHFNFLVIGND
jgi:hypothetical protein